MYVHLVASAIFGVAPFHCPADADWFWRRLRDAFPDALAASLMWNHIHLVSPESPGACVRMGNLLGGFARYVGRPGMFHAVPPPKPLPDLKHLRRTVRYLHLNPCREGLVCDPISWPWSTHRGVLGAEFEPWVTSARLQRELRWRGSDFPRQFHKHVSGDPSANVQSTSFPQPAPPRTHAIAPLDMIRAAAEAATPWASRSFTRKLAQQLAREQGWAESLHVAKALEVSRRTLHRWTPEPKSAALPYARLCLGDVRLFSRPATLTTAPGISAA